MKEKITKEDLAEFKEAAGLCDEILNLLHDRLATHSTVLFTKAHFRWQGLWLLWQMRQNKLLMTTRER